MTPIGSAAHEARERALDVGAGAAPRRRDGLRFGVRRLDRRAKARATSNAAGQPGERGARHSQLERRQALNM